MLWCCCGTPPTGCKNQATFYDPFDHFPLDENPREWATIQSNPPPPFDDIRDEIYAEDGRLLVKPELLYSFQFGYWWTCGIYRCFKTDGSPDEIIPSVDQWWTLSVRFADQGEFLDKQWWLLQPTANFAGLLGYYEVSDPFGAGGASIYAAWRTAVGMAAARDNQPGNTSGLGTWWVCDPRITGTAWGDVPNPLYNFVNTSQPVNDMDLAEQTLEYTASGYKITYKLNGGTIYTIGPDASIQTRIESGLAPDGARIARGPWSILGCQANHAAYDDWNFTSSFM